MKKWIGIFLCLAALALAGCGNGGAASGKTGKQSAGVSDVLEAGMAQAEGKTAETGGAGKQQTGGAAETKTGPDAGQEHIDLDLTVLSSTMVYSEVYNIMASPEEYLGKTMKMKGLYSFYHDDATGNNYFACIIQDATACCAQGIEFVLTDDYAFPDDYPEEEDEICVIGVFDTYEEGEYLYCTLRNARLV